VGLLFLPLSASRRCYGWADAAASSLILHLQKHLFHVKEPELAGVVLLERVQLARRDLVALDRVLLRQEGAHVFDEASRDSGR
jgi:hypothetical protein